MNAKSCNDFFDIAVTEGGLSNREEYYERLSSHRGVKDLNLPILSINSEDDIFCPFENLPLQDISENNNIIQVNVVGGGHITYWSGI